MSDLWQRCLARLEGEIEPSVLHTWLQPLQARDDDGTLRLFAPNTYTLEFVRNGYLSRIEGTLSALAGRPVPLRLEVGSIATVSRPAAAQTGASVPAVTPQHNLDPHYTFDNFVEGKSNQLGKAAAMQVAQNPGRAYNPLLLYGGTGLGKTHLMQAAGNLMLKHNPSMKLLYVHSERFTEMMITALRNKNMDDFKHKFRSVDALLIDDIQFFAGKDATQEEFFHTFNTLYESRQQIILTCDRYPKEVDNLELRLKSRLGWGLSVAIEPPDFETRAAILLEKAQVTRHSATERRGAATGTPDPLQCPRAGRCPQYGRRSGQPVRSRHHHGTGAGNVARPLQRPCSRDHHPEHPENGCRLLPVASFGSAFAAPGALAGPPPPDCDGTGQGIDRT